jgi:hypothetical protein
MSNNSGSFVRLSNSNSKLNVRLNTGEAEQGMLKSFNGEIVGTNIINVDISNNSVSTNKIINSSITTEKINNNAVDLTKLQKLDSSKIIIGQGNSNCEQYALSGDVLMNSSGEVIIQGSKIITSKIADSAVVTSKIADSNVTTAKIADSNVITSKIADANVTTAKINDSAVVTSKIADANVTTDKIANSNVTTAKIADANVTTAKIADSNVTTAKIADYNVTTDKIADYNVTTAKIADANVTTDKIANSNVTREKINDGAINVAKLDNTLNLVNNEIRVKTQNVNDNTTLAASTEFVSRAINNLVDNAPILIDTLGEIASSIGNIANFKDVVDASLNLKANAANPVLTGNVTVRDLTTSGVVHADNNKVLYTAKVDTIDLANNAVTNVKILDSTIQLDKLVDLTSSYLIVGNSDNRPTAVDITGDVTFNSSGVTSIGSEKVLNSMIKNNVIGLEKLADITQAKIVIGDTNNKAQARTITGDITLNYLGQTVIVDDAVITSKILNSNVTNVKLANNSIDERVLATTLDLDANNISFKVKTQTALTNNKLAANTEYVDRAIATLIDSSPEALNTLNELAVAIHDSSNVIQNILQQVGTVSQSVSTLRSDTDASFSTLKNKVDASFSSLNSSINSSLDSLNTNLSTSIELLKNKTDASLSIFNNNVDVSFSNLISYTDASLSNLRNYTNSSLSLLNNNVDASVNALDSNLRQIIIDNNNNLISSIDTLTNNVDASLNLKANISNVNSSLSLKANISQVDASFIYYKTQVDASLVVLSDKSQVDASFTYYKTQVDASLVVLSDKSQVDASFIYYKTQVDASLVVLSDKSQVDASLNLKADKANPTLTGTVTLSNLNSVGVVHNNINGVLSTSKIVALDINDDVVDERILASSLDLDANSIVLKVSTQPALTNNTLAANTEYVDRAIATLIDSSPEALNTLNELAVAIHDSSNVIQNLLQQVGTVNQSVSTLRSDTDASFTYLTNNVDASLNLKANISQVDASFTYYKTQVDASLVVLSDKSQVDASFTYYKTQVDASLVVLSDKSQVDASLNLKADNSLVDASFSSVYTELSLNNDVYNLTFDVLLDRLDTVDASVNVVSTKVNNMFSSSSAYIPSGPTDSGELGEVRFDQNHTYIYCKDSSGISKWLKFALASWN